MAIPVLDPHAYVIADEAARRVIARSWRFVARPEQLPPPGDWTTWFILTGRGWGKTRTGAEFIRAEVAAGRMRRVALVAPTAADARDVMVEGESGIMAACAPRERPTYNPSLRRLTWPNGAMATTYSADEPDRLRGPQHDGAWSDEVAVWRYPETWDMLQLGLRLGVRPRQIATTTPKPVRVVRDLLAREGHGVHVTRGRTEENAANLAPTFLASILTRYGGTRLGRQEIGGELLEDTPGALWTLAIIEATRLSTTAELPGMTRIVVGVDPAVTSHDESDETGIIVAGLGTDGRGYMLDDLSGRYTPNEWASVAIAALDRWQADRIVPERNNGGEMVEYTIRTVRPNAPVKPVHASRGKVARAEPVAALYEQGKVSHVGMFPALEDQMASYVPHTAARSPDRMDALVWALTDLMVAPASGLVIPHIPPPISFTGESTWAGVNG